MQHPPEETLLSLVSGEADLPHRVLLEGHLDSCADCRGTVREMHQAGASLLRSLPGERPPAALWERLRARIAVPALSLEATREIYSRYPLPEGALRELPDLSALGEPRWRWAGARGAYVSVLCRDPHTGSMLVLGHMPPEHYYPRHMHPGTEDILVLTGGFEDHLGHYEAGEYTAYPPGSEHRPWIVPGAECWTLTRLEKPVRFLGWRGWVQRLVSP